MALGPRRPGALRVLADPLREHVQANSVLDVGHGLAGLPQELPEGFLRSEGGMLLSVELAPDGCVRNPDASFARLSRQSAAPQSGYPVRDRYMEVGIGSCPSFANTRSKSSCGCAPGIMTRSSTTQAGTPPAPISSIAADEASIRS